jgi:hypothetical protein
MKTIPNTQSMITVSSSNSIMIGRNAGYCHISGSNNIFIGTNAGYKITYSDYLLILKNEKLDLTTEISEIEYNNISGKIRKYINTLNGCLDESILNSIIDDCINISYNSLISVQRENRLNEILT